MTEMWSPVGSAMFHKKTILPQTGILVRPATLEPVLVAPWKMSVQKTTKCASANIDIWKYIQTSPCLIKQSPVSSINETGIPTTDLQLKS